MRDLSEAYAKIPIDEIEKHSQLRNGILVWNCILDVCPARIGYGLTSIRPLCLCKDLDSVLLNIRFAPRHSLLVRPRYHSRIARESVLEAQAASLHRLQI